MSYRTAARIGFLCSLSVAAVAAERPSCPADDADCHERAFTAACNGASATIDSCTRWLAQLEQQSKSGARVPRFMLGQAYLALVNLGVEPAAAQRFRQDARAVFRDLASSDPKDAQAILALAATVETPEEQVELLRKGIALAPNDIHALQALARKLLQTGRSNDALEAAELLRQAYVQQQGRNKWHLASEAFDAYQIANAPDRAADFRRSAQQDFRATRPKEQVSDPEPAAVARALSGLCDHYALPVIGVNDCLQGAESVVARATGKDSSSQAQALADAVADALIEAAEAESALDSYGTQWHAKARGLIEKLLERGLQSARVYYAHARFTSGTKRLQALERAGELAPADGQVALRLGMEYFNRREWRRALDQFHKAQPLIPQFQQPMLKEQLRRTEQALSQSGVGRQP